MNDFSIEVDKLDIEFAMLPKVYSEYSEKMELVDVNIRKTKMQYELCRAELSRHIRGNIKEYCKEYGVSSLTEGLINTLLDTDPKLKEIQETLLSLERDKKMFASACRSLEMKRDALKSLVQLFQSEYFSVSCVTRKMEEYQKAQENFDNRNIRKEIKMKIRANAANKTQTGEKE